MQFSWSITAIMGQLVAIVIYYLAETKVDDKKRVTAP
jgi:hypothetical protein